MLALFCVLLTLFLSQPLFAEQFAVIETDEVIIRHSPKATMGAGAVVHAYPRLKEAVEGRLQLKLRGKPTIILMNDSDAFSSYFGGDLIVAVALTHRNHIVINYGKVSKRPFSLDDVLKHELCHLILHQHIGRSSLPKWLDEGVAQWISDGVAEIILTDGKGVFDRAIVGKSTIPLQRLADRFPREQELLILAYEQSKRFVQYLVDEYGEGRMRALLDDLANGRSISPALENQYGRRLPTLESDWLGTERKKGIWFTYLSSYLYQLLFVAGAVITIIGFIRFLRKRRGYQEMEDEDTRFYH